MSYFRSLLWALAIGYGACLTGAVPLDTTDKVSALRPIRMGADSSSLAAMEDLVAVVDGIHTPAAMAELKAVHRQGLLYLGPWAAETKVADDGYGPNFTLGVSLRDKYAGEHLIGAVFKRGYRVPTFLLWQTAWERSNDVALNAAPGRRHEQPAAIEWFDTGTEIFAEQVAAIRGSDADVVMLFVQPGGSAAVLHNMLALPLEERLPITAHWGDTAGGFHQDFGSEVDDIDLAFPRTFSFYDPPFPDRVKRVLASYCTHFDGCKGAALIQAPIGAAYSYDPVHLLTHAIDEAKTVERDRVRLAMEALERHDELVRRYEPPFTALRRDVLGPEDFRLATYDREGLILSLDAR